MKAVIDKIEDTLAVLLVGEEETKVDWPVNCLPENIGEGDILHIAIKKDQESTNKQREKVASLIEKLKDKNK
ncbi:MAG: DUF3006 domain-containing protein [Clostridia bacterium]|nr:DUF3006 domain-containing protein [Clostridia bacterium]